MTFWEHIPLNEMNDEQWESLCDGCGQCCLQKLEDEDTGEIHLTDIACKLLDTKSCRCSRYASRFEQVPDCLSVRDVVNENPGWLPQSCAYRRLAEGRPLADWHPLVSGERDSTLNAGVSVSGRCVSETQVPVAEWTEHLIYWPDVD